MVGSVEACELYGDIDGNKMIKRALELANASLSAADIGFTVSSIPGDGMLLIGGENPIEAYWAAVLHQSIFKNRKGNRLPVRIALANCSFELVSEANGTMVARGQHINFVHRILERCPPGEVVVTPSMFALLDEAGIGARFTRITEEIKGLGSRIWYESDGEYEIPLDQRQRAKNPNRPVSQLGKVDSAPDADGDTAFVQSTPATEHRRLNPTLLHAGAIALIFSCLLFAYSYWVGGH